MLHTAFLSIVVSTWTFASPVTITHGKGGMTLITNCTHVSAYADGNKLRCHMDKMDQISIVIPKQDIQEIVDARNGKVLYRK